MNSSAKGCNSPLTISGLSLEGCTFRHGQATDRSIPKGLRCGLGILVPVKCQVPHLTVSQPGKSFITPVVVPGGHSKKSRKNIWKKPRTIVNKWSYHSIVSKGSSFADAHNSKFTCLPRGHLPHWWPSSSDFSLKCQAEYEKWGFRNETCQQLKNIATLASGWRKKDQNYGSKIHKFNRWHVNHYTFKKWIYKFLIFLIFQLAVSSSSALKKGGIYTTSKPSKFAGAVHQHFHDPPPKNRIPEKEQWKMDSELRCILSFPEFPAYAGNVPCIAGTHNSISWQVSMAKFQLMPPSTWGGIHPTRKIDSP